MLLIIRTLPTPTIPSFRILGLHNPIKPDPVYFTSCWEIFSLFPVPILAIDYPFRFHRQAKTSSEYNVQKQMMGVHKEAHLKGKCAIYGLLKVIPVLNNDLSETWKDRNDRKNWSTSSIQELLWEKLYSEIHMKMGWVTDLKALSKRGDFMIDLRKRFVICPISYSLILGFWKNSGNIFLRFIKEAR